MVGSEITGIPQIVEGEFIELQKAFCFAVAKKTPSEKHLHLLYDGLQGLRTRLAEYFNQAGLAVRKDPEVSKDVLALLNKIMRYEEEVKNPEKQEGFSIDLSSARATVNRIRARYISIQHQLTLDQRRIFRSRIARLAGQVRREEDQKWHKLFGRYICNPKREYFKSPVHLRASLAMAITRAQKVAPRLAGIVLDQTDRIQN